MEKNMPNVRIDYMYSAHNFDLFKGFTTDAERSFVVLPTALDDNEVRALAAAIRATRFVAEDMGVPSLRNVGFNCGDNASCFHMINRCTLTEDPPTNKTPFENFAAVVLRHAESDSWNAYALESDPDRNVYEGPGFQDATEEEIQRVLAAALDDLDDDDSPSP